MKTIFGKKYYSTDEMAKMLGVTAVTVRNYIHRGRLHSTDIGGCFYSCEEDIRGFLGDAKK